MARLSDPQHPIFQRMNASIGFDWRLGSYDVAQSKAHARMLASRDVISAQDADALLEALDAVALELDEGRFEFEPGDEDIHMAIERRVTELVGEPGRRLHTARSRNDQVATDMAMFVRAHALRVADALRDVMRTLVGLAERHLDWPAPAYTHLQRAQPVYLSHHLLAYFWMLARDVERFEFALRAADRLPLGSGALAGVNFDVDRRMVAAELGFGALTENSLDAVSNRDFVLDILAAAATCATHLSRLGAEIVLWSSEEFGFCSVADEFASGSSIMPQKRNPDAAELLRAKAPRVTGHLAAMHGVLHALPLAYSKDLQEDKEHLFDAVDTLELCLAAAGAMLEGIRFDRGRLTAASSDELLAATDVADMLVRRGIPFRDAHGIVGSLVAEAAASGRRLSDFSLDELAAHSPELDAELYDVLEPERCLEGKVSEGGTALERVREQLAAAHRRLE